MKSREQDSASELLRIFPVSRETVASLQLYEQGLRRWQAKTNLVSPATLAEFWTRHLADSLQCLAVDPVSVRWVDLGSGGGFPGLVIAIAGRGRRGFEMHLVESIHKKCAFLREMARVCGAPAQIHCERIESAAERLAGMPAPPQVVTARALAPLNDLLRLAEPFFGAGAYGLFHKGREYEAELADCHGLWNFDLVVHPSRVERDSVLLEVRNLRREGVAPGTETKA